MFRVHLLQHDDLVRVPHPGVEDPARVRRPVLQVLQSNADVGCCRISKYNKRCLIMDNTWTLFTDSRKDHCINKHHLRVMH